LLAVSSFGNFGAALANVMENAVIREIVLKRDHARLKKKVTGISSGRRAQMSHGDACQAPV
jgi:hypothetical protein